MTANSARREGSIKPVRVAVINTHPIQYFAPLYAYLNSSGDFDITALYCTDLSLRRGWPTGFGKSFTWDIDLMAGYRSIFLGLRARTRTVGGFFSLIVPEVWTEMRSGKYDVAIIHGHRFAVCWLAVLAARLSGVKVMMRCETHLGLQRSRWKVLLRKPLIGMLCSFCDRLLAIGAANRDYYLAMGVCQEKIFLMPYTVDNQRFMQMSNLTDAQRLRKLQELGVSPDRPVLLYASKFQPRKRPDDLVKAAAELRRRGVEFTLLMVGDGEMRVELERLVKELRIDDAVFAGFINQSELPAIYGVSDIFVLPSENEPWGLIVNEVMCAGLPVVISREVGCVPDLVVDRDNGLLFDAGDVAGLVRALHPLLTDPALRRRMGVRSRERMSSWSYQECVEGLRASLRPSSNDAAVR